MKRRWNIIYSITMALLAIISSILIIYDFAHYHGLPVQRH